MAGRKLLNSNYFAIQQNHVKMQPNIIFGAYMPNPEHAVKLTVQLPVNANGEMGTDYPVTAPPIDQGGLTQGSAITLAGTGFGTRNNQTQEIYDDFEGSTLGDFLQKDNSNYLDSDQGDDRYAVYTDVARSANSTRSVSLFHYNDGDGTVYDPLIVSKAISGVEASGKTFFHWQMKHRWPDPTGAELDGRTGYQVKLGTIVDSITSGGGSTGIDCQLTSWLYTLDEGVSQYTKIDYRQTPESGASATASYYPNDEIPADHDGWFHHYLMIDHGSVGVADGAMEGNLGVNGSYTKLRDITDKTYKVRDVDEYMKQMKLMWYMALLPSWSIKYYFSELCLDSSFKQVWLSDTPTKEASSSLELQKLNSWSDGSIGINVNLGIYTSAVDKYFLIQGDDGTITHVIPANDLIGA